MTLKITCQERCCRRDNKRLRKKVPERKLAYNSMGQGATIDYRENGEVIMSMFD